MTRRVWAPVGERPKARFKRGYKWTYLYGFVHPQSGRVYWLILPTVNTDLFSLAVGEFAKEVGAGEDKHIVLVVDQAGWHTGGVVGAGGGRGSIRSPKEVAIRGGQHGSQGAAGQSDVVPDDQPASS